MSAMHTIFWGSLDDEFVGDYQRAFFDSWDECERYLNEHGLNDPDMYTDDPDVNQTGIYVEHTPRYDAVDADPSYRRYLEEQYRSFGWEFDGSKRAFIAGYMAAFSDMGK